MATGVHSIESGGPVGGSYTEFIIKLPPPYDVLCAVVVASSLNLNS